MLDVLLPNPVTIITDILANNPKEYGLMGIQTFITLFVALSYSLIRRLNIKNVYLKRSSFIITLIIKLIWSLGIVNKSNKFWLFILFITLIFVNFEYFHLISKNLKILKYLICVYCTYIFISGSMYLVIDKIIYYPDSFYLLEPKKYTEIKNRHVKRFYWNKISREFFQNSK